MTEPCLHGVALPLENLRCDEALTGVLSQQPERYTGCFGNGSQGRPALGH